MIEIKELSDIILCSDFFDESNKSFAKFVFDSICEEIHIGQENSEYTSPNPSSFETTKKKFEHVVCLLNKKIVEKNYFLINFKTLPPIFKWNNESLRISAKPIQTDYSNDEKATFWTVIAGGAAFLSCMKVYPPVSGTVAAAAGAASVTYHKAALNHKETEFNSMKEKLQEVKTLIREELGAFSDVCRWFIYLEEVKNSIDALIDYDVIKELFCDLMEFFGRSYYQTNMLVGEFKNRLKEMLRLFVRRMKKEGKLKFGDKITPVAITFVFVFVLWQEQNRMILECIIKAQRHKFKQSESSKLDLDDSDWEVVSEVGTSASVQEKRNQFGYQEIGNSVVARRPSSKAVVQTSESASVQKERNQFGFQERGNNAVALQPFSKAACQSSKSASDQDILPHYHDLEKLLNLGNATKLLAVELSCFDTNKNCWFDLTNKIDKAAEDLKNAFLLIENIYNIVEHYESIANTEVAPLTTIIALSVPGDAREEDIEMAVKPLLPKEAWGGIKLQRMETNGNNWSVGVLPKYSQLLVQQTAIVIKEKSCAVIH